MIVGRSAELAQLDALVDALLDAGDADEAGDAGDAGDAVPPSLRLLLVGEPGAGKSALLDAVARRARRRPVRVLRAAAPQGEADVPRALVEDVRRAAAGAGVGGSTAAPPADLVDVLADLAADRPVLLLLDDLHWADASSLATLSVVLGRLTSWPLGAVATVRPAGLADPRLARWPRLEVGPLDVDSGVALLRASASGTPIPSTSARRLVQLLGGNPLAIREAPRLLTAEQLTGRAALPDPLPVGPGLLTAWGGLVRRLPVGAARALLVACVVGGHPSLLDVVLARSGSNRDDLAAAVAAGLLDRVPDTAADAVALRHPLVRDVVLQVAEPTDIAAAHAVAAGAAAELGLAPGMVVAHLVRAAGLPREQRARALVDQAERARSMEAADVAARAWEAAARATDDPGRRAQRAMQAVRLRLDETLDLADAQPLLDLVSSLPISPADRVYAEYLRGEVLGESDATAALVAVENALVRARDHAPELVSTLLWDVATTSFGVGAPGNALRHLESWPAMSNSAGSIPGWARDALLGTALVQAGRVDEGEPLRMRAREAAAVADLLGAPMPLLLNAVLLDDMLVNADAAAERRLDVALERLGTSPSQTLAALWSVRAWRLLESGRWTPAAALAEQAVQVARAVRSRTLAATSLPVLAWLAGARGERVALAAAAEELGESCAANGDVRHAVHGPAAVGRSALVAGDLERAVVELRAAAEVPFLGRGLRDAVLPARADLVEALVRAGRRADAVEVLSGLAPPLGALRDPLAAALLARAQALTSPDRDAADEAFGRALAVHAGARDLFEESRTRLAVGEHLRRTRRRARAREHLAAAALAFGRLGAAPWAARADEELRAAGGAFAAAPRERLTPQERRVAEAVAQGMSTAEAAAALFLSPRTVEFHLSGVYRKLGISRRSALARALDEAPRPT